MKCGKFIPWNLVDLSESYVRLILPEHGKIIDSLCT